MRIFYCNNVFDHPMTGGEIFYAEILNYLRTKEKVELIIPTEKDLYFLNRPKGFLGINTYFLGRFNKLPPNTIIIEDESYFYNFFIANWFIKLLRWDLNVLVQVCQVPDVLLSKSKIGWVNRLFFFLFLRAAKAITVLSRSQVDLMIKFGALRKRTHVVYISAQKLKNLQSINKKKKLFCPKILSVAHIRPRKGQKILIEALNRLNAIQFEAIIVGLIKDEEYDSEIKGLINKYGLTNKIRFTGFLEGEELSKLYSEADIFVLPSYHEPYGIVVQEAMSFGLPVVASNVDGIPEQVNDGVEGFLVPPGDEGALAEALQRLIEDPGLRMEMGDRGRQRSADLPTWDDVCERFYKALKGVK